MIRGFLNLKKSSLHYLKLNRFSTTRLDNYYYVQPNQLSVLFPCTNSNKEWTQREVHNYSKGFLNGLLNKKFIKDDVVLVRLGHAEAAQKILIKLAAAKIGIKVVISKANNQEQFKKQVDQTKARALIFNSYNKIGDLTVVDTIYRIFPQIIFFKPNQQIICKEFQFLRYLIRTDQYEFPGTINFQNMIQLQDSNNFNLQFEAQMKPIEIQKDLDMSRPIVITDPCQDLAFRAGVLNSTINGKLLICINPNQAKLLSEKFENKIDFICTQPMTQLHNENRILVPAGSKLYKNHPQRTEVGL